MKDRNGVVIRVGDVCVVSGKRMNTSEQWSDDLYGAIVEIDCFCNPNCYAFPVHVKYGGLLTEGEMGFRGNELEIIGDVRGVN